MGQSNFRKSRVVRLILCLLCAALLSGCWDYRGLDELTIVAGIAIDKDEEDPELLAVSFEIIDMHSITQTGEQKSRVLEAKGRSLAEAVYQSSQKLHNYMYFGNCEVVILSREVAGDVGLNHILDSLLRDNEIRDNLHVMVSGEDTAREILLPQEGKENDTIISFNINVTIDNAKKNANSTWARELYQVYNTLALETVSLSLPVISFSDDDDDELLFNGLALFQHDKMAGYLHRDLVPYFLMAMSRIEGGGYYVPIREGEDDPRFTALHNKHSKPTHNVYFDGETLTFLIEVDMVATVSEFSMGWDEITPETIDALETLSEVDFAERIRAIALECQKDELDLFGFGDTLRNRKPKLWEEMQDDWPGWFLEAEIQVECDVRIENIGTIKAF